MNVLVKQGTGQVVLEGLNICSTFYGRLTGYLLRTNHKSPGLLFVDTPRVHTLGMRFPLNLYFFDASMHFLGSSCAVRPMRFPESPATTCHILEIPHRNNKHSLNLEPGEQVSILRGTER
jgi:uncharacterized membrane protein (UPF0127 family)